MIEETPVQVAGNYLEMGIVPVPVDPKGKKPSIPRWSQFRPTANQLPKYFKNESNIGMLLGSASNQLITIDLDWIECGSLYDLFLPETPVFGRVIDGALHARHVLLRSDTKTQSYDAPVSMVLAGKRRIVEVLGTGKQVVAPGSIYADGQPIQWIKSPTDFSPAEILPEDVTKTIQRLAGAALLARLWVDLEGTRHEVLLAVTGALVHAGWDHQLIIATLARVIQIGKDPEYNDRKKVIVDTLKKACAGEPISGLPALSALLNQPVIECLVKWWGLGSEDFGLTGMDITSVGIAGTESSIGHVGTPAGTDGGHCQPGSNPLVWPELLEFETGEDIQSPLRYPSECLGSVMSGAVEAVVDMQQVPVPLAVQSVLTAASTVIQSRYNALRGTSNIPLSLWQVLIAKPGERKTTTDDIVLKILETAKCEAKKVYLTTLEVWKSTKSDSDLGDPGPKPRNPVWFMQDTTTEGLVKSLDIHSPALTLTNSDAAAWVSGYSMRDNRDSATAAIMSQIWSGSPFTSMRASRDEPAELSNRRLTMSLMLQPGLAAELFSNTTLSGQGFLSRCLPAFPGSTIGSRMYKEPVDDGRLTVFNDRIKELLDIQVPMDPITGDLSPTAIKMTGAAMEAWVAAHDAYERDLVGKYSSIEEVANKAAEQVIRLAGIQSIMQGSMQIDRSHIDNSIKLMDWYLEQWLTLSVKLVAHHKDVSEPKQLWDWMIKRRSEHDQHMFNLRDMYRSGPRFIRNKSQKAQRLVLELIRRGYVRMSLSGDYEIRPEGEM